MLFKLGIQIPLVEVSLFSLISRVCKFGSLSPLKSCISLISFSFILLFIKLL